MLPSSSGGERGRHSGFCLYHMLCLIFESQHHILTLVKDYVKFWWQWRYIGPYETRRVIANEVSRSLRGRDMRAIGLFHFVLNDTLEFASER